LHTSSTPGAWPLAVGEPEYGPAVGGLEVWLTACALEGGPLACEPEEELFGPHPAALKMIKDAHNNNRCRIANPR
jgi:hypothetical protein